MLQFKTLNFQVVTMVNLSYHLLLLGESVENFVTLVDLQILAKGCSNTCYEATRFTQKECFLTDILLFLTFVEKPPENH